jgi:type VI secretion system protein ImpC
VLYDISAEEFAADLSAAQGLEETGLYRLLIEQPALDAHQGPLSAWIADYRFEMTPPHAELLGRIAQIAARANAPFIAAIGPDCLATRAEDLHPMVAGSWAALRALPAAGHLALTVPRFLLRTPYGARSEPIESFAFEEFDAREGLKTLLWGNAAILAAVLLAAHADRSGALPAPGRILSLGDMPYFVYTDADGDCVPLPCTERLLTERKAAQVHGHGFVPVLAIKGRPEVRLGGFLSVAGAALAGPWAPPAEARPKPAANPTATATATRTATAADADTDAGDRNGPAQDTADSPPGAESNDADLDALLAGLDERANAPADPGEDGMDADLAALLKGL